MAEIPNIKPNSNRYREQKKEENTHLEKVVKGKASKKQTSALQKFAKGLIPEDAKSIKEYVADEAPGLIQSFLRRLFQNVLDTYLPDIGGYYRGSSQGSNRGSNTTFRYDSIRAGNATTSGVRSRYTNTVYEYENVVFEDYSDAKDVLDNMYECLSRFEKVTAFDVYDLAGVATNATDRNYGWTDLRGVRIMPVNEGWIIDLPRAIPLT